VTPMRRRPRVLCVGAATLDTVFRLRDLPSVGGKYLPEAAFQFAAGMASSAAVAIARLGGTPILWARVGEDDAGRRIIDELSAEGVDCRFVETVPGARSAFATTIIDRPGDRIVVPFYDPALLASPARPAQRMLADLDAVLVDVRWPGGSEAALRTALKADIPTILDADVAPLAILESLAPLARYVAFSAPAALTLSDRTDLHSALKRLSEMLEGQIVITSGAEGCFWFDRSCGITRHHPAPSVKAVDTLSAGDVFHGAFALAVAEGLDAAETAAFANAAAALKCTRLGGRLGAPTRRELDRFLEQASGHDWQ
jgi:sulfofructose kinase